MKYLTLVFLLTGYAPLLHAVGAWGSIEQRQWIASQVPGVSVENVQPSPVEGWYEVILDPTRIVYVSSDGQHSFLGNLYDLTSQENLTEAKRANIRATIIENIGAAKMILFVPENAKYVLTVFTDVECPHCRKLHSQIEKYNMLGIGIRYVFFPRSGYPSSAWDKSIQVWCSKDRKAALTRAKKDLSIDSTDCSYSPVELHFKTGLSFGIRGTPAIFFEDGKYLSGYLPPERMLEYLDRYSKSK